MVNAVPYRPVRDRTLRYQTKVQTMPKESRVSPSDIARVRRDWESSETHSVQYVADSLGVSKTYAYKLMTKQGWVRGRVAPILPASAAWGKFTESAQHSGTRASSPAGEHVHQAAPGAPAQSTPPRAHAAPSPTGVPGAWYIAPAPDGLDEWGIRDYFQCECEALLRLQNQRHSQEQRALSAQWAQAMRKSITDPDEARAHKSLTESMKLRQAMERDALQDFVRITLQTMPVMATNGCSVRISVLIVPGHSFDRSFEPRAGACAQTVKSYTEGCEVSRRGEMEDVDFRGA